MSRADRIRLGRALRIGKESLAACEAVEARGFEESKDLFYGVELCLLVEGALSPSFLVPCYKRTVAVEEATTNTPPGRRI